MKEKLVGASQFVYTHIEKRSLPLEASKALVNAFNNKGSKEIAFSMLERTKSHLSRWIEDSSQVQIYKRFFGYLLKKENLSLAECFSPFVLVNCWESFYRLFIEDRNKRKSAFENIKGFFGSLDIESVLEQSEVEALFSSLLEKVGTLEGEGFFVGTHLAYMINPHVFIPVTPSVGWSLNIREKEPYFRLIRSVREKGVKPIEAYALMHVFFESCPSKVRAVEELLGIDRELELLKEAQGLWDRELFYDAHEVLEEVWELTKSKDKRDCYQGVIRLAIALHHVKEGEKKRAINVLRKAVPQMKSCKECLKINLSELGRWSEEALRKLERGELVTSFPKLRVI